LPSWSEARPNGQSRNPHHRDAAGPKPTEETHVNEEARGHRGLLVLRPSAPASLDGDRAPDAAVIGSPDPEVLGHVAMLCRYFRNSRQLRGMGAVSQRLQWRAPGCASRGTPATVGGSRAHEVTEVGTAASWTRASAHLDKLRPGHCMGMVTGHYDDFASSRQPRRLHSAPSCARMERFSSAHVLPHSQRVSPTGTQPSRRFS
jgi:hypothetical protein